MGSKLLWSAWLLAVFVPVAAAQTPDRFEGRLVLADSEVAVAGASISIVGVTGSARTDAEGRFTWAPVPQVPFQVIVVLSGGQVVRPVTVDALQDGTTTIRISALSDEAVTVLGAAPSINDRARLGEHGAVGHADRAAEPRESDAGAGDGAGHQSGL